MKKNKKAYSLLGASIIIGAAALAPFASFTQALAANSITVTVVKYIDGAPATAESARRAQFSMTETKSEAGGSPTDSLYALAADSTTPYETARDVSSGSDYSTSEVVDGTFVGDACGGSTSYMLEGYTMGGNMQQALHDTPTRTAPSITNIKNDKVVIVWNKTCVSHPGFLHMHALGYVDGAEATAFSANDYLFPMTETWQASNQNDGTETSGTYTLGDGADTAHPYERDTADFQAPAAYSTSEITTETDPESKVLPVGAACIAGDYILRGYKTSSVSFADAESQTLSSTAPSFTGLTDDRYILVYNSTCTSGAGTIGGNVTGGKEPNVLTVTSITVDKATATADGTFVNGWKYTFHVTIPSSEQHLSMKFGDWVNTANSATISAANNIRFSSAQADNSGAPILITAADTYPDTSLNITGDMDGHTPGRQVDIAVESAVPADSYNGTYSTNYGVRTLH